MIYRVFSFFKRPSKKEVVYIDSDEMLDTSLLEIEEFNKIAIDTEFNWRNTYFPELCLVQIATSKKVYIFDVKINLNFDGMRKIFENKNILKIFHAMRNDISILKHFFNSDFINVSDTQIAEKVIQQSNDASFGYKDLVKKYLNINIDKSETNSDWKKRPLKKNQIRYAADDVRYLIELMDELKLKLKKYDVKMEFFELCERELNISKESFSKLRLKKFKKNKNRSSLEQKIFLWREKEAELDNVPPNKIFKESNIKKLGNYLLSDNIQEIDWIFNDNNMIEKFKRDFH